ncbi:MAG: DUF3276 family protein [Treponema sp.]|jgi:hypothetical protein|nr:DUF3276 family protein [Treponema sp.]
MGVRGEIFSSKVALANRTYFFNVKENRMGDLYLNIVESKNRDNGGFERQSVILFADDLQEFLKGFDESLRVLEKEARGKKRSGSFSNAHNAKGSQAKAGEGGSPKSANVKSFQKRDEGRRPKIQTARGGNAGRRDSSKGRFDDKRREGLKTNNSYDRSGRPDHKTRKPKRLVVKKYE